jgi:hypothetical protein
MRFASKLTQFETGITDMPYWRSAKWGPFMYKFKSFSVQQTHMIRTLVEEAAKGNTGPAIRFATATGAINVPVIGAGIQRMMSDPDMPQKDKADVVKLIGTYGTLGVMTDAMYAAHMSAKDHRPGPSRLMSYAISPNISVGFDIATGAFKVPYELWGVATGADEFSEFWEGMLKYRSPNAVRQFSNVAKNIKASLGD